MHSLQSWGVRGIQWLARNERFHRRRRYHQPLWTQVWRKARSDPSCPYWKRGTCCRDLTPASKLEQNYEATWCLYFIAGRLWKSRPPTSHLHRRIYIVDWMHSSWILFRVHRSILSLLWKLTIDEQVFEDVLSGWSGVRVARWPDQQDDIHLQERVWRCCRTSTSSMVWQQQ